MHFKNQILLFFFKNQKFKNFNTISELSELNIKEFFLIDYNNILHCIIIGTKILVPGWSLKIKKILECYINKKIYLPNEFQFSLKDYTYWSHKADIKSRRLRSLGGALRRIISLHKNIYYENFYNEESKNIQFYTVFGNNKKLHATYLAISQNKKIKANSFLKETGNGIFDEMVDEFYTEIQNQSHIKEKGNEIFDEMGKEIDNKLNILISQHRNKVIEFLEKKLYSIEKLDFDNSIIEN